MNRIIFFIAAVVFLLAAVPAASASNPTTQKYGLNNIVFSRNGFRSTASAPAEPVSRQTAEGMLIIKPSSLPSLRNFFSGTDDKYPKDINFFGNEALRNRAVELMGEPRFEYMVSNFDFEYPIEHNKKGYVVTACKKNMCDITDFEIQYFPDDDNLCIKYNVDRKAEIFQNRERSVKWTRFTEEDE